MKTYEKPALNALSLSGNSLLCACDADIVDPMNAAGAGLIAILGKLYTNTSELFAGDSDCTTNAYELGLTIDQYCKHAPEGALKVFSS